MSLSNKTPVSAQFCNSQGVLDEGRTCEDYCDMHAINIAASHEKVEDVFSNVLSVSDHLMIGEHVKLANGLIIQVATWNVLNRKYLKHMQDVSSKDNQLLGGYVMADMCEMLQDEREDKIISQILTAAPEFDLFCLQEVSTSFYDKLILAFPGFHLICTREGRQAKSEVTNRNVTMLKKTVFSSPLATMAFDDIGNYGGMEWFSLKDVDGKALDLNIINVHFPWQNGVDYPKMLLEHDFGGVPTLVCGDFNRGVRLYKHAPRSDHMDVYSNPRFSFPDLNVKRESVTHVCHLKNCGGHKSLMLDRFDHIMLVRPPLIEAKPAKERLNE